MIKREVKHHDVKHRCSEHLSKLVAIDRNGIIYVQCKGCKQEVAVGTAFKQK